MSDPKSPFGLDSSNLFNVSLLISFLILLGVGGVVLYMIFRFRARPGEGEPEQEEGNRRLEIAWTLAPALVLAVITAFTIPALAQQEVDTYPPETVKVDPDIWVIAHQWWWEFR